MLCTRTPVVVVALVVVALPRGRGVSGTTIPTVVVGLVVVVPAVVVAPAVVVTLVVVAPALVVARPRGRRCQVAEFPWLWLRWLWLRAGCGCALVLVALDVLRAGCGSAGCGCALVVVARWFWLHWT